MTIQPQNNNLHYSIDLTFTNSFPRNNNTNSRYSYQNCYIPKVKTNDFNVLIDGKISNNNGYTTGNSLDFAYFKKKL